MMTSESQEARFKLLLAQMKETARIENMRMREMLGPVRGDPWRNHSAIGRMGGRPKRKEHDHADS